MKRRPVLENYSSRVHRRGARNVSKRSNLWNEGRGQQHYFVQAQCQILLKQTALVFLKNSLVTAAVVNYHPALNELRQCLSSANFFICVLRQSFCLRGCAGRVKSVPPPRSKLIMLVFVACSNIYSAGGRRNFKTACARLTKYL